MILDLFESFFFNFFLGLMKGDEIMVINGAIVSDLDMMFIESVLQEELTLCMMLRSSRPDPPPVMAGNERNVDMIESLVCPPPPTDNSFNEDAISSLIVPAPGKSKLGNMKSENGFLIYEFQICR